MRDPINVIAAIGLVLGGALGIAGAMVPQPHPQALLWAIDGAGLVMATALLTLKPFRDSDLITGDAM